MSTNESSPVSLKFVGKDFWGRAVFKGSNGRWYKTTDLLLPEAPHQMTATEQNTASCQPAFHRQQRW